MSEEKKLRRFILTRFFLIFAITGVVEYFAATGVNKLFLPFLGRIVPALSVLRADNLGSLFFMILILAASFLINHIVPYFNISAENLDNILTAVSEKLGIISSDMDSASEVIQSLNGGAAALLLATVIVMTMLLLIPYITGAVIYTAQVARKIREIEEIKEAARISEQENRNLMISNIVHDLKTPMTTVYGYSKALKDGLVPPDSKDEYLEAIMTKSERMNEIISMLFSYVKTGSAGFAISKAPVDICELARETAAFLISDIEEKKDDLEADIPDGKIMIEADGSQMERVITNLLSNAIRHNPEGTRIGLTVRDDIDEVRLYVSDSGPAIEGGIEDKLFEPFVTGDASRSTEGGTGLGLSLSKKICELHGYTLKLVQRPGIARYRLGDEYNKVFVVIIRK